MNYFLNKSKKSLFSKVICLVLSIILIVPFVQNNYSSVDAATVHSLFLKYDSDGLSLNTAWWPSEYEAWMRGGMYIDSTASQYYSLNNVGSYLGVWNNGGITKVDYDSSLDVNKTYYHVYKLSVTDGNEIPSGVVNQYAGTLTSLKSATGYSVMVNGTNVNSTIFKGDSYIYIYPGGRKLDVYVYAGKPSNTKIVKYVTVSPSENVRVDKGHDKWFYSYVDGSIDEADKGVNWSISGQNHPSTNINTAGKLYVSTNETSQSITVKATSKYDSSKYATVNVKIGPSQDITKISINYNESEIKLETKYTEGDANALIYNNTTNVGSGYYIYPQFNYLSFDLGSTVKGTFDGILHGISNGADQVDASKDYYLDYELIYEDGYKWIGEFNNIPIVSTGHFTEIRQFKDFPKMNVYINGELNNNVSFRYNYETEALTIFIPIEAKVSSDPNSGNENGGSSNSGGSDDASGNGSNGNGSNGNSSSSGNASGGSSGSGTSTATKYKNEWVQGKWYNENGVCDYDGTLTWKCNDTGWWVEDSKGWYPVSQWVKIDGKWYYFLDTGYMDYSEYRDGYWLGSDGALVDGYYGQWKSDSYGWWFEDESGWYPSSQWVWINGKCYYFEADGYLATNKYVDGYWVGADGACQ